MTLAYTVRRLSAAEIPTHLDSLCDVLIDCVEGGASVSFMLPFSPEKARAFWLDVAQSAARDDRLVLAAFDEEGKPVGTVQLILSQPENQPHRADVSKLLVHRRARRAGIAQALMETLESEARKAGKTVLVLDTSTGSDAERFYSRHQWEKAGVIPNYALMPDGSPCGTTLFFKQL
ncbi:GNAT family N-acetyltransferase [Cronobacter turicensis]|uniref:GNAT family N-acetyltransferase n=1 Tax=Cronobacter turicensis TaxID=413502 RepID=UPI0024AFBAE5|nr:GNAT family N-acetyltransferase [Cronobacter turicensis]ELY4157192.1 GNAT family N-acetyltransferase [Cronobacter turicensis]ELY4382307.1 GNAT family N-acetyltransferase [Cronobacter turicensis]ELY4573251.1 GNAT family N-acetyltransferase [Cronobacter turicensis]ELY4852293.1 GNAT family N-acetyltransferase [Cronobacter turicensis]ELY6269363.1 GNAT family N-acetyltransferase [Cronobacter turicensis]